MESRPGNEVPLSERSPTVHKARKGTTTTTREHTVQGVGTRTQVIRCYLGWRLGYKTPCLKRKSRKRRRKYNRAADL